MFSIAQILKWFVALFLLSTLLGCSGNVTTGKLGYTADSVPPEIWHIDVAAPGLAINWKIDPVKGIELAAEGIKTLIPALP